MKNQLLLILLLFSLSVSAQKNFLPGYVVYRNNDTSHGYINYRGWEVNPKKIEFQKALSASIQTLTIKDLKYFKIEGQEAYRMAEVVKDMAPVIFSKVEEEGYLKYVKDTVFLLELMKGNKLALYELRDAKFHYYLQEEGDILIPLQYKVFHKRLQTASIITHNIFRDQLRDFTTNSSTIELIQNSKYNRNDLVKVVRQLDPTTSTAGEIIHEKLKRDIRFLVGGGVSYNRIRVIKEPAYKDLDASSPAFNVITGVNIFSRNNLGRLFLNVSLGYSSYHWQPEFSREANLTYHKEIVRYDLKLNTLSTGLIFNYSILNKGDNKIYLGTGAIANFASTPVNEFSFENASSGEKSIREPLVYEKMWFYLPVKLGVNVKNLDISLVKSLRSTFNQSDDLRNRYELKYSTTSLLVAYQFK